MSALRPALAAVSPSIPSSAHWLLHGPAQIAAGEHAGAVAGRIDADGTAAYAYPEITGYFLHWLAWHAAQTRDPAPLASRAAAAQRWLRRWLAAEPPATRIYVAAGQADWRNDAVFCFDVAMVLRGLAAAVRERLLDPDPAVVAGLCGQLDRLVGSDGAFDAYRLRQGARPLAARWSTRRGGFLAKAAAGVLAAADVLPSVPERLVAAAEATFVESARAALDTPHAEVHPRLYALEGVLSRPRHPRFAALLSAFAGQYEALLAATRATGEVPESLGPRALPPDHERYDVLAQALRAGLLLAWHRPHASPDRVALARLRQRLVERLKPTGAVPHASGAGYALDNVWATMFAEQALGFAGLARDDELAARAGSLLV